MTLAKLAMNTRTTATTKNRTSTFQITLINSQVHISIQLDELEENAHQRRWLVCGFVSGVTVAGGCGGEGGGTLMVINFSVGMM